MNEPLEPPSYDEIVAHLLKNGVSKSQLQESCGDFLEISNVVADWKLLARYFGMDKGDVEAIERDEKDEATRQLKMFETWKQRMGHKATYDALIKVFLKAGKAGFVEGIRKVLTRQGQQVTPTGSHRAEQMVLPTYQPSSIPQLSETMANSRHAYPERRYRDTHTLENAVLYPPFPSSPADTSNRHLGSVPVQDSEQGISEPPLHALKRPLSVSTNFHEQCKSISSDAQRAGVSPVRSRKMRDLMLKSNCLEEEYENAKIHRANEKQHYQREIARLENLTSKLREEADDYRDEFKTKEVTREREAYELRQQMEKLQLRNERLEAKLERADTVEQELQKKLNDATKSEKATSEKCCSLQQELDSLKQKHDKLDKPTENEKRISNEMYDTTSELDCVFQLVLKDEKVHDKAFKAKVKTLQVETEQRKNCTWPP